MDLYDIALETIDGRPTTLAEFADRALLIVNVASHCKLAPQYAGLQALHDRFAARGFSVLGFPCNQFNKEPGTHEEIHSFATMTHGVTFPLFSKINVNDPDQHPLFQHLVEIPDTDGEAGAVEWNYEKFIVSPRGTPVARFRSMLLPEDLVAAVEAQLPL